MYVTINCCTWPSSSITFANSIYNGNVWAGSYMLYQTDPIFYGHTGDRQEVAWRDHVRERCARVWWLLKVIFKLLYFCSKSCKKRYFIGNVYDNIKSSSEGGCRLIQKEMWRWQHISTQHNLLHIKARSIFSPVNLCPQSPSPSFIPPSLPPTPHCIIRIMFVGAKITHLSNPLYRIPL